MPKVTIIMPLYNKEKYINFSINCLIEQSFKDFECIIIDDASTDKSVYAAYHAFKNDSRFKLINNKVNSGLPATRNIGLIHAHGEYVLFLDSDDLISSDCLENRISRLEVMNLPFVAGCYGMHKSIGEEIKKAPPSETCSLEIKSFEGQMGDAPFVVHSPLLKTSIAIDLGGFNEKLSHGAEDYDFWMKILRHGYIFVGNDKIDAFYRQTNSSMASSFCDHHLDASLKILSRENSAIDESYFYEKAILKMREPAYSYAIEKKYFNRIFNFLGMELAQRHDIDVEQLAPYVPHFYEGFPQTMCPWEKMANGIKRAIPGIAKDYNKMASYEEAMQNIISRFNEASRNIAIPKKIPSMPPLYSAEWERQIDLVFIPHKDYHVEIIQMLKPILENENIRFVVADLSALYRDEGARRIIAKYDLPYISVAQLCMGDFAPKCVTVFNDWDPKVTNPAMRVARHVGIIGLGIVEGVQDYWDMDTGRVRNTYHTCTHVITPGKFDTHYFGGEDPIVYEGGMPILGKLAREAGKHPYQPQGPILINSNFSYGMLSDKQAHWIKEAVDACADAGKNYIITRHPADKSNFSLYKVTPLSMYDAIWKSSIFVSRFGTSILEALAMGRPVIYFNPHGERIDKYKEPMGAYLIANSRHELQDAIHETMNNLPTFQKNWEAFLEKHGAYENDNPYAGANKVADIIVNILKTATFPDRKKRHKFGKKLSQLIAAN